jgi:hypothetical protein
MSDLPPDLNAFAARLATLQPAPRADRDRMLFEAGRRSARANRTWPLATLGMACLAGWLSLRPPTVVEQLVVVERPVPREITADYVQATPPPAVVHDNYFHLREAVLRLGVDALPQTRAAGLPKRPLSAREYSAVIN